MFDTSALLSHYRGEPGSERVQALLGDENTVALVAAPSISEFARRLMTLGFDIPAARQAALDYASLMDRVVEVDTAVAIRAFELSALASARVPLIDALIAASAHTTDAILVHRDHHFQAIGQGLVTESLAL